MLTPQLEIPIALFIVCVFVWFILIVYKKKLEREEEEKVFLGSTPERLGAEQTAIMQKVNRLSKPMWTIGILTVFFLLASLAVWIYQGLLAH